MSPRMALFGLVWLLRVRGSLCGCAACRRARAPPPRPRSPSPCPGPAPAPELSPAPDDTAPRRTRHVTVQTDFDDDDIQDLDKIELQIAEESTSSNYEAGGGGGAPSPAYMRRTTVGQVQQASSESDNESVWETAEVTLERGAAGLGLSVAGGAADGPVSVSRLADGGAARADGRLRVGDVLLQVNDVSVKGAPHSVAVDALQRAGNTVTLRVRRARRPRVVSLWRGARGLGLGVAGGADDAAGGGHVFISHIAVGGAAHHDARLALGDRILAVRDENGIETGLVGATHAAAVHALRAAGERVTLVVLPAAGPPAATTHPLHSMRTQATSCSTLHELLEEAPSEIPRCVRMVRLVRSGSRLGMDIVGGLGGESDGGEGEGEEACGVFVSGIAAGGAARGLLHRGDRILSVDGCDLTRATHEQAAAALKYSGGAVTIAAQYQPEQYDRLRARIRAINAAAHSPRAHLPHPHPGVEPHIIYPR